jgi:phage terminase small subunit
MRAALRVPGHLEAPTRAWIKRVLGEYDLEEHHFRLLVMAGQAFDRAEQARKAIAQDGAFVRDRYGQVKAHPGIAVERDARIAFARLVRELDLDGEPLPDPRMPRRRP